MDNQSANPVSQAVDASTSPIQVGIPSASDWQVLHRVEAQALEGLFSATEKVLNDCGIAAVLLRGTTGVSGPFTSNLKSKCQKEKYQA